MTAQTLVSNVMAGCLVGIINITVAISVSALIFAGAPSGYFAVGTSILLIATLVTGLGGTLTSGFRGVICAPRSGLAPVFAGMTAGIIAALSARGAMDAALPTIIATMMVTTLVAGLALFALGQLHLGGLIRYIPYPVMGGFFAGIGFIFVRGGLSVSSGEVVALDRPDLLVDPGFLMLALPAVIFALALFVLQRTSGHWAVFPVLLAIALGGFHAILLATGTDMAVAVAGGWLPDVAGAVLSFPALSVGDLGLIDWGLVAAQAGSMVTVALLVAIILLLDVSGIEILIARDLAPDRELKSAGIVNIVNALLAGFPASQAASDTAFTYKLGAERRLMGFVYAGAVLLAILAGSGFIQVIPTFVLGGLLLYVGIDFLADWAWSTRRALPIADYLVVIVILAVIAAVGILEGVAFGFAVAVVLFVVNYSRLSIVKTEMSGAEHASNVDRDLKTRRLLNRQGRHIWLMTLQGFIFFGTAEKLVSMVKDRLAHREEEETIRFLVLDFRHVSQLDVSAIRAFNKLAQLSDQEDVPIIITGIDAAIEDRLTRAGFFTGDENEVPRLCFDQLDDGVAWCEERILADLDARDEVGAYDAKSLLARSMGDESAAGEIAHYFKPIEANAGDFLFHQGESGDCLYMVARGSAAVVLTIGGKERVLRVFKTGALVGEMALYTGAPRTAGVRVEEDGRFLRLDQDDLRRIERDHPKAAGAFHSFIVRLLAERLDRANREIQRYV